MMKNSVSQIWNSSRKSHVPPASGTGKLGTFSGVFTPSILTILGIILFLRMGFVVGSAGFGRTLVIIALANAISVLTSVSLAAIATNLKVKGGGDYYLISRTLGVEFGGAIGLVLFLAQSVSIAFYCIGFGEAIGGIFPHIVPRTTAVCAVLVLFVFAWLGSDWATRFQFAVMGVLAASLVSFFAGGIPRWSGALLVRNWHPPSPEAEFWTLFAVFFPAVTGFTQGISMSGDLKDPAGSLPLGTFLAVGVSILVYFAVAILFAGVLPNTVMTARYDSMKEVSRWGFLIDAGVVAATLSSAMASFMGAPRILQSLAGDRIFKFLTPFARGEGETGNPRRGILLSGAIAVLTVMLGKLNLIAPLVSMFFLISYGLLNYATYYEARAASPAFRPTFRWFHQRLSLLGFLTCLGVMLAIDTAAGITAAALLVAVYHYLKRTAGPARWADGSRAYHLQRARENLLAAARDPQHPRDWRPMILAMTNDTERRSFLLSFAGWIEGGSGITCAVRFIEAEGRALRRQKITAEKELSADIRRGGFKALPIVIGAPDVPEALPVALQAYGIGPLRANTLLINWLGELGAGIGGLGALQYANNLRSAFRMGLNIIILKTDGEQWGRLETVPAEKRTIDIWWQDDDNGRLMLMLAHLMRRNDFWEESEIRVLAASPPETSEDAKATLERELEEVRIQARVCMVEQADSEVLATESAGSSLVFLSFALSDRKIRTRTGVALERIFPKLPTTALVMAAEEMDLAADPEEGVAADLAAAADTLEESEKNALVAEEKARKARQKASELMAALDSVEQRADLSEADVSRIHGETIRAIADSEKAFRKASKARAKALQAAETASELGLSTPDGQNESGSPGQSRESRKGKK